MLDAVIRARTGTSTAWHIICLRNAKRMRRTVRCLNAGRRHWTILHPHETSQIKVKLETRVRVSSYNIFGCLCTLLYTSFNALGKIALWLACRQTHTHRDTHIQHREQEGESEVARREERAGGGGGADVEAARVRESG